MTALLWLGNKVFQKCEEMLTFLQRYKMHICNREEKFQRNNDKSQFVTKNAKSGTFKNIIQNNLLSYPLLGRA
jgi:hypothetical protein